MWQNVRHVNCKLFLKIVLTEPKDMPIHHAIFQGSDTWVRTQNTLYGTNNAIFYCFKAFKALSYWVFVLLYLFFPACPKTAIKPQNPTKTHWAGLFKKNQGFLNPAIFPCELRFIFLTECETLNFIDVCRHTCTTWITTCPLLVDTANYVSSVMPFVNWSFHSINIPLFVRKHLAQNKRVAP